MKDMESKNNWQMKVPEAYKNSQGKIDSYGYGLQKGEDLAY